jgi:hypothetical protein
MKTKTLAALLSAATLLSGNVALACGAGHRAGNPYSAAHSYQVPDQTPRPAKATAKQEGQTLPAPGKASEANPVPVSPSLAAGLDDAN